VRVRRKEAVDKGVEARSILLDHNQTQRGSDKRSSNRLCAAAGASHVLLLLLLLLLLLRLLPGR
jgi:hypothetical protein